MKGGIGSVVLNGSYALYGYESFLTIFFLKDATTRSKIVVIDIELNSGSAYISPLIFREHFL